MTARVSFHFGTVGTLFELASGTSAQLACRYYDARARLAAKQRFLLGAFRPVAAAPLAGHLPSPPRKPRARTPFPALQTTSLHLACLSQIPLFQPSKYFSGPACPVRALISTHQSGQHRHPLEHGAGQQPAHHHDAGSDPRRPFAWDRANYSAIPQRVDWRASHDLAPCTFGSIQGTLFPQILFPCPHRHRV
jgi:hypothetical protein